MPNQLGGTQKAVYTAQPRSNLLPTGHNAGKQWEHPCVHHERQSFYSSIPQHIIHILGTATGVLGKYFVLQRAKNPPFSTLWDARPLGSSN
jgi:hypothetical protein